MAAFGALGSAGVGTGTLTNVAYPTGITAGQLLLCFITHKYSGVTVAAISDGFTLLTPAYSGGSGSSGADSGIVVGTIAWKIASGSESGNISSIVFSGAVNAARGQVFRYTTTGTGVWDLAIVGGSVNTPTVSWSVAMDGDPGILDAGDGGDDMLIAFSVKNADLKTASGQAITGTGLTSNLVAERLDNNGSTGDDFGSIVSDHSVIASLTSGVPTYAMSMSGTAGTNEPAGATIILRVREVISSMSYVDPSGIASTEAFGTATIETAINVTGIASAEAFGTATIDRAIDVGGIASAEAFGSPTIEIAIDASGIASAEAFGAPTVDVAIDVAGIASGEAFGSATLEVAIDVAGISSLEAFGTPSLALTLDVGGIASAEAFGTATIEIATDAGGIPSGEAFGSPTIEIAILVAGIASLEAFGTAEIVEGRFLEPAGIVSAEAFGTPTIEIAILVVGIPSAEAFGALELSIGLAATQFYRAKATPDPYRAGVAAAYRAIVTLTPYRAGVAASYRADDD